MAIFPTFFLGNIGQEIVFYDILERKNTFLCYKNMKSKKPKNWHFSKGVNPWFWSSNGHFSNFFFLGNIGQEIVFYFILERKNTFLGYNDTNLTLSAKTLTELKLALTPEFPPPGGGLIEDLR